MHAYISFPAKGEDAAVTTICICSLCHDAAAEQEIWHTPVIMDHKDNDDPAMLTRKLVPVHEIKPRAS